MIKKDLCLSVRDQVGAESMGCIDPYPDEHGNYRVRKWVTYRGTVIHCAFFERHLGWRFYIADRDIFFITKEDQVILRWHDGCGIRIYDFVRELCRNNNDEIMMLFIHSCFCRMVRTTAYAAADAADAAADAAEDAADAAAFAAAHAAVAAEDAVAAAEDAVAAACTAAAYAEAAADSDSAYAARRAFRKMIILRKEVAKLK